MGPIPDLPGVLSAPTKKVNMLSFVILIYIFVRLLYVTTYSPCMVFEEPSPEAGHPVLNIMSVWSEIFSKMEL